MDRKLYVERWLLELKAAAAQAGLAAHVRALDFKGGQWLAFDVQRGDEVLGLRYRKRRTGARMVAASTGAQIVARVRDVHVRLLREHRGLLENGLRRFLRRSIRLLEALESAWLLEDDLPQRLQTAIRQVKQAAPLRPAALVRSRRGTRTGYEVLPAALRSDASGTKFAAILEGRLVPLSDLFPDKAKANATQRSPETDSRPGIVDVAEIGLDGIELLAFGVGVAVESLSAPAASAASLGDVDPSAPVEAIAEAGSSAVEGLAETAGAAAEGLAAVGGTAAEAISSAGGCLPDAACGAIDCGGIDCVPG